jgi:3-methyladenine DNA glycosylase/8-oxoguanine DNA glycosylase
VLGQLYELRACRDEVRTYRDFVARDIEQDAREKANAERALELEQQATGIARQERDLAREKAALYEQMYRSLTKRPGVGCWVKRIFTLGMARCS